MLFFGGSISAGTFSLSGFFSVLAGAFVGAMLIMEMCIRDRVLFLSACSGTDKTVSVFISGDTIPLRYADNLTLVSYPDYTIATLRNPWDTLKTLHTYILVPASQPLPAHLPEGTIVRTPLRKSDLRSAR